MVFQKDLVRGRAFRQPIVVGNGCRFSDATWDFDAGLNFDVICIFCDRRNLFASGSRSRFGFGRDDQILGLGGVSSAPPAWGCPKRDLPQCQYPRHNERGTSSCSRLGTSSCPSRKRQIVRRVISRLKSRQCRPTPDRASSCWSCPTRTTTLIPIQEKA